MTERCVYVVRGTTGEYSGRSDWAVRAFTAEQYARDFAADCLRVYRAERQREPDRWAEPGWKHPFDPQFREDYTGTDYTVERVPLTDGAWREVGS